VSAAGVAACLLVVLEDGQKKCAQSMNEATLFIIQQIYIFMFALVGFVSHNELSVHGHE
jgi:hypothetical protein